MRGNGRMILNMETIALMVAAAMMGIGIGFGISAITPKEEKIK